jgi:SAM-dependent methyltransferase
MEITPFLIPQSDPQVVQQNPQTVTGQPRVRQFNVPRTQTVIQTPVQPIQTPVQPIVKPKNVILPSLSSIKLPSGISGETTGYHQKATAKSKADDRANERLGHILKTLPKGTKINSILDIGAGNAEITDKIAKALNVTSAMAVDQYKASEFIPLPNSIVTYAEVVDTILPAPNNSMDLVVAFMSIHHIKDTKKLFSEICRVLRTGGFLFFREHDVTNQETGRKMDDIHLKYVQDPHEHSIEPTYYWDRRNLQNYLTQIGFEKVADSDYDYKNNAQNIYHSLYRSVDCKSKLLTIYISDKSEDVNTIKQSFNILTQQSVNFVNNWEDADVIWKPTATSISEHPLPKLQYFNNLLTSAITEKGNLLQVGISIFGSGPTGFYDITPFSFEYTPEVPLDIYLPVSYQTGLPDYANPVFGDTLWTTRPAIGFTGKVINLYNDRNMLIRSLLGNKRTIIQKYIENPMLINERKFDVRMYVLITDNKILMYTEGYARLVPLPYNVTDLSSARHLTETSLNNTTILLLNQIGVRRDTIYDFIKRLKPLFDYALEAERQFKAQNNIRFETFELLGIDIMFDATEKPWLLGITKNPDLLGQMPSLVSDIIKETIFHSPNTTKFIPLQEVKVINGQILRREPFPYKKEFLNAEQLWTNAVQTDLAQLRIITVPKGNRGWYSIPKEFKWEFQGNPVAIVVSGSAYDSVDKLVDFFSEENRMKAQRKGCSSPYDFYENNHNQVVTKAQELQRLDTKGLPYRHWLREAIYMLTPECTAFKASVTKAFLKYVGSKIVLDPSAGWGDRLLGAAAAGVDVYHGVDPNPLLRNSYDQILDFIKRHGVGQNFFVLTDDFLQVNLGGNLYDTVFTSPPFFDYEIYSNDAKQSIMGRETLESWTTNFLYPYINKAWNSLIPGGTLALYISDTRSGKYVQNMYDYVNTILRGNFLGIIAVTDEKLGHAFPLWIWLKRL